MSFCFKHLYTTVCITYILSFRANGHAHYTVYSAKTYSSDSFCSLAYRVSMQSNVLTLAFVFCFVFPLEGNAELMSLVTFGLNYVFGCTAVCDTVL